MTDGQTLPTLGGTSPARFAWRRVATVVLIAAPAWSVPTRAESPTTRPSGPGTNLARYVPADVLMAYWGRFPAEARADDHVVMRMLKWVDLARQLNLIPKQYRTISDIAGSLPLLGSHEHVVMLMDVSSRPVGPEGYRLAHMQVAVVLATGGEHGPVVDRIRRMLATYTDKQFGKIEVTDRDGSRSYRLTDARLPVWATWEWGPLGDGYVIGLGRGAFDRVAKTYMRPSTSIERDPWFVNARRRCRGQGAMIEWLVNYQGIHERLEPVVKGRPEQVLEALGAGELQRGLAAVRMEGRYLVCYIMNHFDAGDQFVPLSHPKNLPEDQLSAVPPGANCAIMQLDLIDWACRLRDAYLASQTAKEREEWHQWLTDFQRRTGVHVRSQLLDRLGRHLIIHDWPAHPLRLPLTFTLMVEIDDPAPVQDAIDAMMGAWQEWLAWWRRTAMQPSTTGPAGTTRPARRRTRGQFRPTIGREPDGMWYIQAGVVRPAIAVSDRYIVISWSPEAVRANLRRLGKLGPKRGPASTPTTSPR